jgi:hypothetical protein
MRTFHILSGASALLLTAGTLAAGCISNTATPSSFDGGFSLDGGSQDATPPVGDATTDSPAVDATVDAGADASPPGDAGTNPSFSTATVDFGLVNCGSAGSNTTYSFTNTLDIAVTYSASVTGSSLFSIVGSNSGSVAPGQTGSLTLGVGTIPATSTAGTALTATLAITTNIPGFTSVSVPLKVTPQGGSISVTPSPAAFGGVQIAYPGAPIPVTIANVGNAPVTLTFAAPTEPDGGAENDFVLTYPGSPSSVTLAAGASLGDAGVSFKPSVPGAASASAAIQTTSVLCASASGIDMTGTGTTAQISMGPDPLNFGLVPCGTTAGGLAVTITNSSPNAVSFGASLGLGGSSPFTIDTVDGGVVPGASGDAGTTIINVTPKKIVPPASVAPGAFNDTLVVSPNAPFVNPTTIHLQESAQGAILVVSEDDAGTGFGTVVNTTGTLPFTVTNVGNVDAPLQVMVSGAGFDAGVSPTTATADGGTSNGVATFTPTTNGDASGTVTVTTTAVMCAAPPALMSYNATGEVPVAGFKGPVNLSAICAAGAGTSGSLFVTNSGNAPLVFSGVHSQNGSFTVVSAAPIPANSTGPITIQANPVLQNTTPGGQSITDALVFTTNEPGNPTYSSVTVSTAVDGANLSYSVLSPATDAGVDGIGFGLSNTGGSCITGSFTVLNSGTLDATLVGNSYPVLADDQGDATGFQFGGTFSPTAATVLKAGGGTATDSVSLGFCTNKAPCDLTALESWVSSSPSTDGGAAGTAGVCIPLPPLNIFFDQNNCDSCCG